MVLVTFVTDTPAEAERIASEMDGVLIDATTVEYVTPWATALFAEVWEPTRYPSAMMKEVNYYDD